MRKGFELAVTLCVMTMTACGPTLTDSHKLNISAPKHIADDLVLINSGETSSTARFSSTSYDVQTASVLGGELRIENQQVLWHVDDVTTPVGIIDKEEIRLCQDAQIFDCEAMISVKPGDTSQDKPLVTLHMRKTSHVFNDEDTSFQGESTLIQHTLPSPNQDEAGTCLFMATTGAAEIILNQKRGTTYSESALDGATDLSERFLMNVSSRNNLKNWLTDTIQLYGREKGALKNRDYRYTKGWFKYKNNRTVAAKAGSNGAEYGTQFNWVDHYSKDLKKKLIDLPDMKRDLLFVDPEHNQWNVGIMDDRVVDRIKSRLKNNKQPVVHVYNHHGYWHAVVIVGYDDNAPSQGCPFVDTFIRTMSSSNPEAVAKVKSAMANQGGCSDKGVFYVRDSIYTGIDEAKYDYDLSQTGDERPYSKRIVTLSYGWAKYLGNHAFAISADM